MSPEAIADRAVDRCDLCHLPLMVSSRAQTVPEYLRSLPSDRREAISAVRNVILKNLPAGFEEGMQYGMISYYVPLSRYPVTYNGQPLAIAGLASQKQYMSVYLMGVYGDPDVAASFEQAYAASGKKLDMGKSCVRFKRLADLPLDVIGETIAKVSVDDYLAQYERARGMTKGAAKSARPAAKRPAGKSPKGPKKAAKPTRN